MASGQKQKKQLYYARYHRSHRCIWLIREMGVADDFEFVRLDLHGPDVKAVEDYKKNVHPHGTIPALVVESEAPVLESGAICMYLADLYGKLVPEPKNRKDYYDWIVYANCTMDAICEALFDQWVTPAEKRDDAVITKIVDKFGVCLNYLNKALKDREFICGDKFTAADCVLGYNLYTGLSMMDAITKEKNVPSNVSKYFDRLKARPAFQETDQMK